MGSGQYINQVMNSIEERTSATAAMPEEMVKYQLSSEGGVDLSGVLQFEWQNSTCENASELASRDSYACCNGFPCPHVICLSCNFSPDNCERLPRGSF